MHILSPWCTDNCPSWISGREKMTVENISWSISTKECCRHRRGLNQRPPGYVSEQRRLIKVGGWACWYELRWSHISLFIFLFRGVIISRTTSSAISMVEVFWKHTLKKDFKKFSNLSEPYHGKRIVIADANSTGSGEPAHARSLARTCAVRSRKR